MTSRCYRFAAFLVCLPAFLGCGDRQPSPPSQEPGADAAGAAGDLPLVCRPNPLALGTIPVAKTAKGTLTLSNPGSSPLTVDRVESSCPCVSVAPLPVEVPPNQSAPLTVTFNPAEEPEFRGSLGVEVKGMAGDGRLLFRTRVDLKVEAESGPTPAAGESKAEPIRSTDRP